MQLIWQLLRLQPLNVSHVKDDCIVERNGTELLVIGGDVAVVHRTLLEYDGPHRKVRGLVPKCCEEENVLQC